MYKIGLSISSPTEENFQKIQESGIEAIELCMSLEMHQQLNHKEVLELSRRYGIALWSYHLPFRGFKLSYADNGKRERSIAIHKELIEKAADLGINKFIVHPSDEPIPEDDGREEHIKYSMQSLDTLAEFAHKQGAVIAVEDLPRTCLGRSSDEMLRLLEANSRLRVCFDTNHLLLGSHQDFIEKLGDKIVTLHVSDYDFIDEKHWLPGEGLVNWNEVYTALQKVGYSGVWMYEVGLKTPQTLKRSRDLTFDDFVRNAQSIFSGQTPARID